MVVNKHTGFAVSKIRKTILNMVHCVKPRDTAANKADTITVFLELQSSYNCFTYRSFLSVPSGTVLLQLCHLKCGPGISSNRFHWELIRNAACKAQSQTQWTRICFLNKVPPVVHVNIQIWEAQAWVPSAYPHHTHKHTHTLLRRKFLYLLCCLLAFGFV